MWSKKYGMRNVVVFWRNNLKRVIFSPHSVIAQALSHTSQPSTSCGTAPFPVMYSPAVKM